ncbi:MAG TPA: hypothetical protein VGN52_19480 [Burkholderiales bacterium]|jgi:hypothetical protein
MIGNLLSSVFNRGIGAAQPAPAAVPVAAPATAAPAAEPAPADNAGGLIEREEFFRRKKLETDLATLWMQGQLVLQALMADPRHADPKRLERYGWKSYSQSDEDGILAEILQRIGVKHRTFVEFGAGDGLENNTTWLLAQGWRGLWMDGGEYNADLVKLGFAPLLAHGVLQFQRVFVTLENVDELIAAAGLGAEVDVLSIDVDGNDVYLWEAISRTSARVVVIEYNGKFPPPSTWSIAYNPAHLWKGDDYMGASLGALVEVGRAKGYRLAGCNFAGNNAFFVRDDLAGDLFASPATAEHLYQPARYDLIHAYRSGHGANSLSVVRGAQQALGLDFDMAQVAAFCKPHVP